MWTASDPMAEAKEDQKLPAEIRFIGTLESRYYRPWSTRRGKAEHFGVRQSSKVFFWMTYNRDKRYKR